jgi:tetratricopeptide (TPR) repeat protein
VNATRATLLLGLLLCAAFCLTQLAEVDFYWHLLAGSRILATGRLPVVDDFTWTSANRPWVDLHWLFEITVAEIYRLSGWAGLDLLKVISIVSGFALAARAAYLRRPTFALPLLLVPGVVASQERFTLRPEAASFLLLGLLLVVLAERTRHPRLLMAAPVIVALWANTHALFAAGLGVLILTAVGDSVDAALLRRTGAPSPRGTQPIVLAALAAIPASLLTPYGLEGWRLAARLLFERVAAANLYGRSIAEFQAPFSGFGPTAAIGAFALFAAIVIASLAIGRVACTTADTFVSAAFLALALLARRNIPLFVLVALPAAAPAAAAAGESVARVLARRGVAGIRATAAIVIAARVALPVLCGLLVVDVVSNRFFARDGTQRYFGSGPAPGFYPEKSAAWVVEHDPARETVNDMTMGGYLAWRWYPGRKTFIDGRLEIQDPGLYASYLAMQRDPRVFEDEASRRGIGTVVWSHRHALDAVPLLQHLAGGHGWRLAHVDLAAAVFIRDPMQRPGRVSMATATVPAPLDPVDIAPVETILAEADEAERSARASDPIPAWARRLCPRLEVPVAEVGCGLFLAVVGQPQAAVPILEDAVRRAPWSAPLRYDLGLALLQSGRAAEAGAAFEEALRRDPAFGVAAAGLGLVAARAGDLDGALAAWDRAERSGDLPATVRRARGGILAGRGRIDEAIEDYRSALASDPGQAAWHGELASLYAARGLFDLSRAEIGRASTLDPSDCAALVAEARLRRAEGDRHGALEAARHAAAVDPECADAKQELERLLQDR